MLPFLPPCAVTPPCYRFPWWPAIIIGNTPPLAAAAAGAPVSGRSSASLSTATDTSSDTSHHQQQQQPGYTPGAVLVRFLGTHDAAWVEPGKALSRWGVAQHERASKTKAASFVAALREAGKYLETGEQVCCCGGGQCCLLQCRMLVFVVHVVCVWAVCGVSVECTQELLLFWLTLIIFC